MCVREQDPSLIGHLAVHCLGTQYLGARPRGRHLKKEERPVEGTAGLSEEREERHRRDFEATQRIVARLDLVKLKSIFTCARLERLT